MLLIPKDKHSNPLISHRYAVQEYSTTNFQVPCKRTDKITHARVSFGPRIFPSLQALMKSSIRAKKMASRGINSAYDTLTLVESCKTSAAS